MINNIHYLYKDFEQHYYGVRVHYKYKSTIYIYLCGENQLLIFTAYKLVPYTLTYFTSFSFSGFPRVAK